jgi:signal transduction histidine kinase
VENKDTRTRWFETLGVRIFTSHLLAIAAAIALVSFALLSLIRTYFLDELEKSLRIQAQLITGVILPDSELQGSDVSLPSAFNTLQQQQSDQLSVQIQNQSPGVEPARISNALASLQEANIAITAPLQTEVYIFDRQLEVVLTPPDPKSQPFIDSGFIQQAIDGRANRTIVSPDNSSYLLVSSPLTINDNVIAALVLSHPLGDLEAVFQNLWLRLAVSALISLILASIISLIFTRNVQKPLLQLRTASDHLSRGDYDYPVPEDRADELGDLSRAFDAMRTQLKSTEQLRTRFLSDVAHELRTPLTSIKSLTETLEDGAVDDPQVRDRFLYSIEHETDRLIRLTRDLLTLTRADVEGIILHKEQIDLNAMIGDLFLQFETEASRKSIQFELLDRASKPVVFADRDRIGQVFINLLDNALRNAPEGSTISVQWLVEPRSGRLEECESKTHDHLHAQPTGDHWLIISVLDQGPGIPIADQERVFDRFYRVEQARDRSRGGSGLGLPIAKAIIEAHGGCIWIDSPPESSSDPAGANTAVRFCLPYTIQSDS